MRPDVGQEAAYESVEGGNVTIYGIRAKGPLHERWSEWFDGLEITNQEEGETLFSGKIVDQAALHGVTRSLRPS